MKVLKALRRSLEGSLLRTFLTKLVLSCRLARIQREVVLNAWEPRLGNIASEFIALEGNIKQSFFGTFGISEPIDYVFYEYKKLFCVWDCPISKLEDDQLEGGME